MVVSDHYLNKCSHNPFQAWCVHSLGECWELIRFWAMLAKFWPSTVHKRTKNSGFRTLSEKEFMQSSSDLVYTLVGWVLRNDLLSGHFGQILSLWWPKNDWKWWFLTIIWKSIHAIQFRLNENENLIQLKHTIAIATVMEYFLKSLW